MIEKLGNNNEHSYLCLVAIYVIHVILFHVCSPPEIPVSKVIIMPQSSPHIVDSTFMDKVKNVSSLFAGVHGAKNLSDVLKNLDTRIVGGTEATSGQFPHLVSLRRTSTGSHFCGGNLIAEEWVVTAAHCVVSDGVMISASTIRVYVGGLYLSSSTNWQSSLVSEIIYHEDYDETTIVNDIALLRMKTAFELNNNTVMAIPLQNTTVGVGTNCTVGGWGTTSYASSLVSNTLLYTTVPIMNTTICRTLYYSYSTIPEGMICAGYVEGGYDACQGDSGSGLNCGDYLTGLVSWGVGCAYQNYPGVYTEIRLYRDWILEKSNNLVSSSTTASTSSFPMTWGVILGCLAFLLTFTDHQRVQN